MILIRNTSLSTFVSSINYYIISYYIIFYLKARETLVRIFVKKVRINLNRLEMSFEIRCFLTNVLPNPYALFKTYAHTDIPLSYSKKRDSCKRY